MAESDLLVTISGAALSLLFFENVRSNGNQMGFLLGEVLEYIVKTYTDSDNQVETTKMHINVETIVTCSLPDILSNSSCINKEQLKNFIHHKSKHVIGWFCFRQNGTTSLVPSLKDKLLHKQFAKYFSDENGCKEDLFLTCLLNASTSEMHGTHKFRHVFLRRKRGIFEPISLRINNLGDDASRHDGSDYKPIPARKSARGPDGFTKLIESLNLDMTRTGGLDAATMIQQLAEHHLTSLIPKVCETDLEVSELERQVRELRAKVLAQRLTKKSKINGERCVKEARESPSEKLETDKIGGDTMRPQKECISISSRTSNRNTAACIAKSVNQDKLRQIEFNMDDHQNMQEQSFSPNADVSGGNRNRHIDIPEIISESICPENSMATNISDRSMGRGRGRGSINLAHEYIPEMRKTRRSPSGVVHRERSMTPEQDFCDASVNSQSTAMSPISRSYIHSMKKSSDNSCNVVDSLDI